MKLVIFRHGRTDGNVKNIIQGAGVDCPLNEEGKAQAEELKQKLTSLNLPIIYCSTLCRAQETAEIAASSNNCPVIPINGLEEVHFGEAEGMLSEEAHKKYADILEVIHDENNPLREDISIPGGETVRQSTKRALKALDYIKNNCPFEIAGVASHGALMFNIYKHYFNENHRFENCECFEIEI